MGNKLELIRRLKRSDNNDDDNESDVHNESFDDADEPVMAAIARDENVDKDRSLEWKRYMLTFKDVGRRYRQIQR